MEKFSNKYIDQFDVLKKAVLGFEFEFYTDRSYYKLLELLNRELDPIKIWGRRKYHSDLKPDAENFKIEPDLSMGNQGVELITGPMPYHNAKLILLKILKILQTHAKTDEKCSLHINVSFDKKQTDKTIDKLNRLKIILAVDENNIYKYFPTRRDNFYAKTVKRLVPFKGYDYTNDAINILVQNLQLPDTKYYGINVKEIGDGRLEFRYIGDTDYQFKTKEIIELMDYFIMLAWNSISEELNDDEIDSLRKYLDENINNFKNFNKFENFIAEFPTIQLEIDKNDEFVVVKSHYGQIYPKIYDMIKNIDNLNNCIINYDTNTKKLELVDADFKTIFELKYMTIIDSSPNGGTYLNCRFIGCDIKNSHLYNCEIIGTEVFNCKCEDCNIDQTSELKKVYFNGGNMDGDFVSGVFRSGKIGEFGELKDGVKIISDTDSYFNTNLEDDNKESSKPKETIKKLNPYTNTAKF